MTKPQLTFLRERVPINLGFFSLRDLSINWYTINPSYLSTRKQVLPNIRRHPPYASSDQQCDLPIFSHVPTFVLARQPDASGSLRSSFASVLQHGVHQHAVVRILDKAWLKPRSEAKKPIIRKVQYFGRQLNKIGFRYFFTSVVPEICVVHRGGLSRLLRQGWRPGQTRQRNCASESIVIALSVDVDICR